MFNHANLSPYPLSKVLDETWQEGQEWSKVREEGHVHLLRVLLIEDGDDLFNNFHWVKRGEEEPPQEWTGQIDRLEHLGEYVARADDGGPDLRGFVSSLCWATVMRQDSAGWRHTGDPTRVWVPDWEQ